MARSFVANGLGYAILVTKPANDMSYSGKALASRPITDELPPVRFVCVAAQRRQLQARRRGVQSALPPAFAHAVSNPLV